MTNNIPRPNLIPFTEPYAEGGSMHPGTRLKALQGTAIRKHSAIKPTSSTNEGKQHTVVQLVLGTTIFKDLYFIKRAIYLMHLIFHVLIYF